MSNNVSSAPLLNYLNNYGNDGKNRRISGDEIHQLITRKYSRVSDLIPNNSNVAIVEPLIIERKPLIYEKLLQFINEFDLFRDFGISYGERVSIILPNGPELAVCLISVINRWCAAPINPTSTPLEIKHELESTKSKAIIIIANTSNDFFIEIAKTLNIGVIVLTPSGSTSGLFSLSSLIDVPVNNVNKSNVNKNLILLLHTSGTSGNKKLVPYTVDMVIVGVACIISSWNLSPSDVCLNMMPLFHIGGIMRNILSPILSGGSVICCSGFDPVLFWDVLYEHRVTWYYAAPTMHHAILQQVESRPKPLPVDSVRFIANAAGGLLPILAETLQKEFDCIILTSYGMTECMPISSPSQEYRLRPIGTSGLPVGPEVIIAIDNDDGKFKPCATMEPGNIFVRNYPCFTGYENDEAANAESFATINKKKYFNTGDVGYLDAEGHSLTHLRTHSLTHSLTHSKDTCLYLVDPRKLSIEVVKQFLLLKLKKQLFNTQISKIVWHSRLDIKNFRRQSVL